MLPREAWNDLPVHREASAAKREMCDTCRSYQCFCMQWASGRRCPVWHRDVFCNGPALFKDVQFVVGQGLKNHSELMPPSICLSPCLCSALRNQILVGCPRAASSALLFLDTVGADVRIRESISPHASIPDQPSPPTAD